MAGVAVAASVSCVQPGEPSDPGQATTAPPVETVSPNLPAPTLEVPRDLPATPETDRPVPSSP